MLYDEIVGARPAAARQCLHQDLAAAVPRFTGGLRASTANAAWFLVFFLVEMCEFLIVFVYRLGAVFLC